MAPSTEVAGESAGGPAGQSVFPPSGQSGGSPDTEFLEQTVSLCRQASEMTLGWFNGEKGFDVEQKGDGSPVTEADRQVEAFLRQELGRLWPDDALVGEEWPDVPGTSGRTWFIDPIDGTKSFVHGVPLYACLLAMHDESGPAVGMIGLPALGQMVYAARGQGCFVEDYSGGQPRKSVAQVKQSPTPAASSAPTVVCLSGMEYLPPQARQQLLASDVLLRTWGDAYGYTLLATGKVDAMIDFGMNPWDTAPLAVIVPEAGGIISSWQGGDAMASPSVLAATPEAHTQLVQLLSAV